MAVDMSIFRDALPYRSFREADWNVLSEAFEPKEISASGTVFKEGDPGDGFYLIRTGHVKICRQVALEGRPGKQEQLLTVLGAGHLFGEMALIEGDTRSADALTDEGTLLYQLSGARYGQLKKDAPATALRLQDLLVTTLCGRLRAANKHFEIIQFWLT